MLTGHLDITLIVSFAATRLFDVVLAGVNWRVMEMILFAFTQRTGRRDC
jgi:hypothetical protein